MTKKEIISVWRGRISYLQEKRRIFFEGSERDDTNTGYSDSDARGASPGCDFAINVFRGESKPYWWNSEDAWIHIGKLKSAVRAALPSLLYSNPEFKVLPAAVDVENNADVAYERAQAKALWLNHIWRETHGNTHIRVAIQNAFFSLGVIKAGYCPHFEDDTDRGVFAKTEDGEYILDENGDPTLEKGKFLVIDGEVMRDEYGIPIPHPGKVAKEEWFIEAVDPRLMLFDVDGGVDFFQHRFVIEEWYRPLEEVKKDDRYSAAARKRLTATTSLNGPETQRKSVFETAKNASVDYNRKAVEKDEARVRGYDIYDFQRNKYYVLPESAGDGENNEFLLEMDIPPGMEHGPYRFLKFTEDIGTEWYPIPDAIDMALVNQEYNLTRSQMVIHREHTKTRYLETPGAFETDGADADEERAKASNGPDSTFVKVRDNNSIFPMPKANLDGSFMQAIPNINLDFNEVGGMPGANRGVADADSATEASILASGAETRNNDRRDNQVATFINEVGRMLLMSGQANAELDTLVIEKVAEQTGVVPFKARRLSIKELLGEFEVTVQVGSTMAKNDPRVLQEIATMVSTLAQNPAIGMMTGLIRRWLDGLGLDPLLAEEIFDVSQQIVQMQNQPQQGGPEQQGQVLQEGLMNGLANMAGGAPTGAPTN